MKTILIDNGHGRETPGKCSPDGTLREWQWTRTFARLLAARLTANGFNPVLLVPEETDVPLSERVRRANTHGPGAILRSIHNNAAGNGSTWTEARGFSAFVAPNASAASRSLAAELTRQAVCHGLAGNRATPPCGYWTASLAMCRDTRCTAVLTENLFMDNRADLALLHSPAAVESLLQAHVAAIASCSDRREE